MIFLLALMVTLLAGPAAWGATGLSRKSVKLHVGKTVRLKLKKNKKKVTWTSSKPKVAEIVSSNRHKAVILGKKAGKTVITAKVGDQTFKCKVKVKDVKGAYSLSLDFNQRIELTPEVTAKEDGPAKQYVYNISAKAAPTGVEGYETAVCPSVSLVKMGAPKNSSLRYDRLARVVKGDPYSLLISVPNYFSLLDSFASVGGPMVYHYKVIAQAGADRIQKNLTIVVRDANAASPSAQRFISTLFEMDRLMRLDNDNGKQWTYKNKKTYEISRTFDEARQAGNYRTNCVSAVQWGLLRCNAVDSSRDGIQWYGSKGIVWLNANAEANARKYFNIIPVGSRTVKQCLDQGIFRPGDIITYKTLSHTNVYLGDGLSFDSGHVNCLSGGEGAKFLRWIRETPYTGYKVAYILRLKK